MQEIINYIKDKNIGKYETNYSIKKLTSYKVGGKTRLLVFPKDEEKLILLLKLLKKNKVNYKIIGNGSNLLFSDKTYDGVLIKLTEFNKDKILIDPFCGSGTIPIEAAMIASNIPPSVDRAFVSETWDVIAKEDWKKARMEALENINQERLAMKEIKIFGFDIDPNMIRIAKENAERADVADLVHFETCPVKDFWNLSCVRELDGGIILSNPPYGERLEDRESIVPIYKDLKVAYDKLKNFDMNVITSFEDTPKILGKETKNRKLYNGMIKTYLYSYIP